MFLNVLRENVFEFVYNSNVFFGDKMLRVFLINKL